MMRIKNVDTLFSGRRDFTCVSTREVVVDGSHLTALPALVDPHVHFRTPGDERKEDWKSASIAALFSGVTTVLDMPNNIPSVTTLERVRAKKKIVEAQLHSVGIDLHFAFYLGADRTQIAQIAAAQKEIAAVKVFMGGSTGDLLVDHPEDLAAIFKECARLGLVVAVHAEDQALMKEREHEFAHATDPAIHSTIRNPEVAKRSVALAIDLAERYGTTLYVLHVSTQEELSLIRAAKKKGLPIFAEATPHHLLLSEEDYATFGAYVLVNPPLRSKQDQKALFEALCDGTIDTIGTDHAPHLKEEKEAPYGKAPSGIPSIELLLPLLLDLVAHKRLTWERFLALTRENAMRLFSLPPNDDWVLCDLNLCKKVEESDIKTKCGWSPYLGRELTGWPCYVILNGSCFSLRTSVER